MDEQSQAVEAEAPAEVTAPQEEQVESAAVAEGSEAVTSDEQPQPGEFIPRDRLNEEIAKRRELEERVAQMESQTPQFDPYAYQEPQQSYFDPMTGEIDAQAFEQSIRQQAVAEATNQVRAELAWRDAEVEHPELKDPTFRKAVMGMVYAESTTSGKLVTPSQAAKSLKSLTNQAKAEAVQAQQVKETIQDAAHLVQGSTPVKEEDQAAKQADQEFEARVNSRDKKVREEALLEIIARRKPDVTGAIG